MNLEISFVAPNQNHIWHQNDEDRVEEEEMTLITGHKNSIARHSVKIDAVKRLLA
jgi:hypothetical protein